MSDELVIGVDVSTTGVKAIAWSPKGEVVAQGQGSYPLENPETQAWEQDAKRWWSETEGALCRLTHTLGSRARNVQALAVTHQRETFVLTDENNRPLAPGIVWMDSRGAGDV